MQNGHISKVYFCISVKMKFTDMRCWRLDARKTSYSLAFFTCFWSQRTQHAVVPKDPAAVLGPVHTDLQPVPPSLPDAPRPPLRRPAGTRGPEWPNWAWLLHWGRLGVPHAVRGVSLLLILHVVVLFLLCWIQSGKKDFKSRKLPLLEPDQAQGPDAPQQQQRGPEEQTDPVPGRPDQHHERALWCGQGQKPASQGGGERASAGANWTEEMKHAQLSFNRQPWPVLASQSLIN